MNEQLPMILRAAAQGADRSDSDKVLFESAAFEAEHLRDAMVIAHGHLAAAVAQTIPSDDRIIADHTRNAYQAIKNALYPKR